MLSARHLHGLLTGLPQAAVAYAFAEARHAGQTRSTDGAPFILHPLEVATLLHRAGSPDHVVAAGLLHDVIEKGGALVSQLHRSFGLPVAVLVASVSEDPRIPDYVARKAALRLQVARAGADAITLFAADKVTRLRELRGGPVPEPRQLDHLAQCVTLVEDHLPGSPFARELRSELRALRVEVPSAA